MMVINPITWKTELGGCLWVQGQPDLNSEFLNSQDYTEKSCIEKRKKMAFEENVLLCSPRSPGIYLPPASQVLGDFIHTTPHLARCAIVGFYSFFGFRFLKIIG